VKCWRCPLLLFAAACAHDHNLPLCEPELADAPTGYTDFDSPLPRHFREGGFATVAFVDRANSTNPVTNAGAHLGRVLFYDVRLSANDSVACSSCHRQSMGFGDTSRTSTGIHGRTGSRKPLPLANARFSSYGRYFWDERAASLEKQVLVPVIDTLEMGMRESDVAAKLSATSYYPALFAAAFGSPEITNDRISKALAQFIRSLVSAQSRFDAVFATGGAPDWNSLTESERVGQQLFIKSGCANCHRTVAQIADQPTNNGLDVVAADTGAGKGRFKPGSLRNVAIRPPYMHDGRFASLDDVVDFYSHGVANSPDIDRRLLGPDSLPRRLNFSSQQRRALVAFLESLTDSSFLHDPRFANPFQQVKEKPCRN